MNQQEIKQAILGGSVAVFYLHEGELKCHLDDDLPQANQKDVICEMRCFNSDDHKNSLSTVFVDTASKGLCDSLSTFSEAMQRIGGFVCFGEIDNSI